MSLASFLLRGHLTLTLSSSITHNHSVAEVAEYMLFTPLLRKCPSLFVNHFVEALVVLNGCVDHDSYKAALSQGVRAACLCYCATVCATRLRVMSGREGKLRLTD